MEHAVGLDFETKSEVDIRKHGLDRYMSHPSTEILMASVHDGANTTNLDFVTQGPHQKNLLFGLLRNRGVVAHNSGFERACLRKLGALHVPVYIQDSAVIARARGAASKLEAAAPQLVNADKMDEGRDLIRLFSMPQKDGTFVVDDWRNWDDETKKKWETFGHYCDLDSELSYDLAREHRARLNQFEHQYENLTNRMNERGWYVDLKLVRAMQEQYFANLADIEHAFRTKHDPAGELNFRSTVQLRKWCAERHVRATSFDELHVGKLLDRCQKEYVRLSQGHDQKKNGPSMMDLVEVMDLLITKQELGGSSLSKLQTIIDMTGEDGRLRNQYLHAGAAQTMRTSGRGVQMQNLKRLGAEIDDVSEVLLEGSDWDNQRLARNLRQVFEAEHPNGELIVGDFSAVESRGLAYLAGEDWKVTAYRQGRDMYKVLASSMLDVAYDDVDKSQRQQGKVGELSCGYGAGPGAVATFAEKMGMALSEADAQEIVMNWREANPAIVGLWKQLDSMLHEVVEEGRSDASTRLPNGDLYVHITQVSTYLSVEREFPGAKNIELRLYQGSKLMMSRLFVGAHMRGRDVCYLKPSELKSGNLWRARWTKNGQSGPYKIYGGKLTGILTQSFCRELFFQSLLKLEGALMGTDCASLIGQFHDEAVVEWTPFGSHSLHETMQIVNDAMTGSSTFPDFPLVADVKHGHRYIK